MVSRGTPAARCYNERNFDETARLLSAAGRMADRAGRGRASSIHGPGDFRDRRPRRPVAGAYVRGPLPSDSARGKKVMPIPSRALPDLAAALCFLFILLVPFAAMGLAMINTGLGRSRNAAHMMLSSLCVIAVAAVVYFAVGFSWQGYAGRPGYAFTVSGKLWNWIAAEPFFWRGLKMDGSADSLAALLGMLSVGLAAIIPLGSGADRWRLGASCASAAVLAGWTFPLFAHWVWGGGWLAQLGVNYGLGLGFIDAGGASSIHVVGGLTALAVTWILGPRRGKYSPDGMAPAIPGHNGVFVLFGCLLALLGWFGLNSAGAILFTGGAPAQSAMI